MRFDRVQAGFVAELDGRAVPCLAWVLQSGSELAADVATDDIQDIYMPSAVDNYKRKIAVELERRRRTVESDLSERQRLFSPVHFENSHTEMGNCFFHFFKSVVGRH